MFDGVLGIWRFTAMLFLIAAVLGLRLRLVSYVRVDTDEPTFRRAC